MKAQKDYLRLGLVGFPILHSPSPGLHAAAMRALGLDGEYQLYPVAPIPEGIAALRALVDRLRKGKLHGLNITIPHKQAILPLLDGLTPEAEAIGAVNTLLRDGNKVIGTNTDAPGFIRDFVPLLAGRQDCRAWVLGAGGAARAVAYGLVSSGWQVIVSARRLEQARQLAADFEGFGRPGAVQPAWLESEALTRLGRLDAVINATPLGAFPQVEGCPWPFDLPLPQGAVVYDLIYHPAETRLLRLARESGLAARGGLGMLVEQAGLALELWSGQPVPRQAMWNQVEGVTQ